MTGKKRQAPQDPDYSPSGDISKKARDATQKKNPPKKQSPRKRRKQKTKADFQKEATQAKKDLKSVGQEIEKLVIENQELRAALRQKSTPDQGIDDMAIQNKFDDIIDDAYNWTRMYSCDGRPSEQAVRCLKEHALISSTEWLNCREEDIIEMARLPISSNIFLNSILTRFIFEELILRPFVTLPGDPSQRRATLGNEYAVSDLSKMLQQLTDQFYNDDRYGATKWISHTLNMVYPSRPGSTDHARKSCPDKFYEDIAAAFFESYANCLIREDIKVAESKKDLILLFRKANELRIDIWKQSVDIRPHLLGSIGLGEAFQPGSNIMKAHSSIPQDIAPGSRLWMAITPAVTAYWLNSVGEERSKVWAKAVVWAGCTRQLRPDGSLDKRPDAISKKDFDKESHQENSESFNELNKGYDTASPPEVKMEKIKSSSGSFTNSVTESLSSEELPAEFYDDILALKENDNMIMEIIDLQSHARSMLYFNEQEEIKSRLRFEESAIIRLQARIRGHLVRLRK
ncbi:conserved hypothetical protein [Paecilomyces variotii No. 5]|uniref:Uncharacterized protein n=1 Tax=Byssochlamys spectabilis (strain No. 5 / NBRC 109023) TaxID=1356009 RepID=V5GEY3_BYSSN|nr:conserved hypothetical protein [Paecilomyces variotii No. 5]